MSDPLPHLPLPVGARAGYVSNAGRQRYMLEAESTSGFVAFRLADGTTLVSNAQQVSLRPSSAVRFWSCAGWQDTSPAGSILSFDCHGNGLTEVDVVGLVGLEYLDVSFNSLQTLRLTGLSALQGLDVDQNHLTALDLRGLRALRVLNCAGNPLPKLDLTDSPELQILDCGNGMQPQIIGPARQQASVLMSGGE